jgi:hypothetical protein
MWCKVWDLCSSNNNDDHKGDDDDDDDDDIDHEADMMMRIKVVTWGLK